MLLCLGLDLLDLDLLLVDVLVSEEIFVDELVVLIEVFHDLKGSLGHDG